MRMRNSESILVQSGLFRPGPQFRQFQSEDEAKSSYESASQYEASSPCEAASPYEASLDEAASPQEMTHSNEAVLLQISS